MYPYETFSSFEKQFKENVNIKHILIKVFILLKILDTRPIYLLGILSKRKEFRNILTPELAIPRKIETNNNYPRIKNSLVEGEN